VSAQTDLLRTSRIKAWEPLVWLLAFASPLLGVVRFIVKQRQARRAGA